MKLAVLQLRSRGESRADLDAMLAGLHRACDAGAELVVCPLVPSLVDDDLARDHFREEAAHCTGVHTMATFGVCGRERTPLATPTPLGRTVELFGDECIDPALFDPLEALAAEALVWRPDPESPLQAEAFVEFAISASLRFAGLVVVSSLGAGQEGFGDSAVVYLGDVLAEALDGEEVLITTLPFVPVPRPERRGQRPELPPILQQRLAVHRRQKPTVSWPADMS